MIFFIERADRAAINALTAGNAGDIIQAFAKGRIDPYIVAAAFQAYGADALNQFAGLNAASTQDSL